MLIFLVALLLSASTIDQEEANKLVEEVTAEVKADETAPPKSYVNKTSTTKTTTATKKASSNAKFNGRTVTKKTNTSSGLPKPTAPGRSPITGRKNPLSGKH